MTGLQPRESIYIKGLKWAYEKEGQGFSKEEFQQALAITNEEWDWAEWLFFNGVAGDSPLIWTPLQEYLRHEQIWGQVWYLSPSGMAAATDYLELKEAQKSGRQGFWLAMAAIAISVFVGIAQIYYQTEGTFRVDKPSLHEAERDVKG